MVFWLRQGERDRDADQAKAWRWALVGLVSIGISAVMPAKRA